MIGIMKHICPMQCAKCTKYLMQQKHWHLQTRTSQISNLNSDFNMRNAISPICVHLCVWGDSKFPLHLTQLACSGVHFSCTFTYCTFTPTGLLWCTLHWGEHMDCIQLACSCLHFSCTLTPAGLLWCTIQCNALRVALVYIGGALVYTTLVHCTSREGACA